MPVITTGSASAETPTNGKSYLLPLTLVTSLFFLWGLAYGLLDVLNKHFQDILNITKQRSTLLQAAYFGAYFLVAIPAGIFISRFGYKKGILVGLLLYALGAFLFYPSASMLSFSFFLFSLFVLASGLTILETAANPYITVLGDPKTGAFRLNLSQSFNGIGAFIGPILGGQLFFSVVHSPTSGMENVKMVYLIIGGIVLSRALIFFLTSMPEVHDQEDPNMSKQRGRQLPLFKQSHFTAAVIAQFFYVAAQVGAASLFINYCTEKQSLGLTSEYAAYLLSGSLMLFTFGRFMSTAIMKFVTPQKLLATYAFMNMLLCFVIIYADGMISVYSLMALFFFESIMFPTIFALGIRNLGTDTKRGGSFIIMSIVGGAIVPFVMGSFQSTATAFIVPLFCFAVVFYYGIQGYKIRANAHL
jgi:MFS transporter, FHS family, L-fucose permease